ncbi:MAG: sulfatase [Planctomycetaceae bacterium]|nr:sulfatase [Planctomycetaceae bacterium]
MWSVILSAGLPSVAADGPEGRQVAGQSSHAQQLPNILFISVDDLNDWIGCLGGHPQARTPNFDRLAASGMLFTNAHCPAPACNPSRGAIMSGVSPHRSGLYDNRQQLRDRLPHTELLPRYLSRHGYWSAGSGKLLHYIIDAPSWDTYFPAKETEDPFPRTWYPAQRPVSLPRGGDWQYVETDWAPLDISDEQFGGDWLVTQWISEQLSRPHKKPFFLACGIYRPHEPWFVPQPYFAPFPLEDIQLPPGYREDDLADVPPAGQQRGRNRYFDHIRGQQQWKQGIQGYLASIYFADAMLGRVLNALENGPHADNTIVMLWSDHGWHLGEKQHWQKFTGWRVCTRVPLMIRVPQGTAGLPQGTPAGSRCAAPVNLVSLFPTLTDLAGLPAEDTNDGPSLVPLLANPESPWPHVSMTYLGRPGNYGLSGQRFRYIAYDNGDEELYDIATDPHEWTNLASRDEYAAQIRQLKQHVPTQLAPYENQSIASLPELAWIPAAEDPAPPDTPPLNDTPQRISVWLSNKAERPVRVFRINTRQQRSPPASTVPQRSPFGTLETGWTKPFPSSPGDRWLIEDLDGRLLGHFDCGTRRAIGNIPKPQ